MLLGPVNPGGTLVANMRPVKFILGGGAALASFVTFMALREEWKGPGWIKLLMLSVYLFLIGASLLYLLFVGTVGMSPRAITYRCPWGRYEISWDKVEKIEVDERGALAFLGGDKSLVLVAPSFWSGKDKAEMIAMLGSEIERRAIPVEVKRMSLLSRSRNTKVSPRRAAI